VRQACSALVDRLLEDNPGEIELRPMTKFPVLRDLMVDRSRLFRALQKVKAWIPVDGYYNLGPGPRQSQAQQEEAYPLSECMSCGCCLEVCPQVNEKSNFVGPAAIGQTLLFNLHPVGKSLEAERLDYMTGEEGITNCGNAQNCVKICKKKASH
jgi:succinate dehydrogenase / fumarate reductase iron-sulfur subunit